MTRVRLTYTVTLLRIDAPHYCAGIELVNGIAVRAAPILHWTEGKHVRFLLAYFKRKRFNVTPMP